MSPAVSGINFTLSLGGVPDILGGQRNVTMNWSMETIDKTSRDSAMWYEYLAGLRGWTIDFDGLFLEDDSAEQVLEDAWIGQLTIAIILTTPAGNTYSGTCLLTAFSFTGPYSAESTATGTLQGTGELQSTAS